MRGVAEAMVTGSNPAEAEGGSILSKVRDLVRRGASIDNARALHYASGTEEALELMVELPHLGGNPNQPDELGNTALHVAAVKGSPSAIKLLTLVGAGRTARDAEGRTPPPPGALLRVTEGNSDFAITFGMGNCFREVDWLPKLESLPALLTPDRENRAVRRDRPTTHARLP